MIKCTEYEINPTGNLPNVLFCSESQVDSRCVSVNASQYRRSVNGCAIRS
uniref:Uncharacterized protein n=1 Tax=Anguilla anguilla TaxID=7936 RepID=A0A0E9V6F1_ANGAN